jgi:hypothetical protein
MKALRMIRSLALATTVTFASSGVHAATATFNFDADTVGNATPFADTNNGITASFSSPADPGGFQIFPNFLTTLTGNVLVDPGPAGASNIPLNISFSQPIASISFLFGLNGFTTDSMSFSDNAGGSQSATGTIQFGIPEGSLSFSGAAFTSVTLSSSAMDFAIDDIVVTTATPLPTALPLFATGIGALGLLSWRRKRKAQAGSKANNGCL